MNSELLLSIIEKHEDDVIIQSFIQIHKHEKFMIKSFPKLDEYLPTEYIKSRNAATTAFIKNINIRLGCNYTEDNIHHLIVSYIDAGCEISLFYYRLSEVSCIDESGKIIDDFIIITDVININDDLMITSNALGIILFTGLRKCKWDNIKNIDADVFMINALLRKAILHLYNDKKVLVNISSLFYNNDITKMLSCVLQAVENITTHSVADELEYVNYIYEYL